MAQDINIIPQLSLVQKKQGSFIIKRGTPIVAKSPDEVRSGKYPNAYLNKHYGFSLPIKSSGSAGIIIKANRGATDSYVLDVDPKKVLGWDEILEGGLAPNAWVMSWRGEKAAFRLPGRPITLL